MRWLALALLATTACAHPSTPAGIDRADENHAPAQPEAPAATKITIDAERITVDGVLIGSTRAFEQSTGLARIHALFDHLKQRREIGKATRPDHEGPYPGEIWIVVAASVPVGALMSVFQTAADAGYPSIWIAVDGRFIRLLAHIPGPPLRRARSRLPSVAPGYVVHAEGGPHGWRLRVPKENGPVDDAGTDLPGLRETLRQLLAREEISAVVAYLDPKSRFATAGPFLAAVSDANRQASLSAPITLAVNAFEAAPRTAKKRPKPPAVAKAASPRGHLEPELIQRTVRGSFSALRRCYEATLQKHPTGSGRVISRFTIGIDGTVTQLDVRRTEGDLPASIIPCMTNVFAPLRFPAPQGGIVTVSYPIVFTAGH